MWRKQLERDVGPKSLSELFDFLEKKTRLISSTCPMSMFEFVVDIIVGSINDFLLSLDWSLAVLLLDIISYDVISNLILKLL